MSLYLVSECLQVCILLRFCLFVKNIAWMKAGICHTRTRRKKYPHLNLLPYFSPLQHITLFSIYIFTCLFILRIVLKSFLLSFLLFTDVILLIYGCVFVSFFCQRHFIYKKKHIFQSRHAYVLDRQIDTCIYQINTDMHLFICICMFVYMNIEWVETQKLNKLASNYYSLSSFSSSHHKSLFSSHHKTCL